MWATRESERIVGHHVITGVAESARNVFAQNNFPRACRGVGWGEGQKPELLMLTHMWSCLVCEHISEARKSCLFSPSPFSTFSPGKSLSMIINFSILVANLLLYRLSYDLGGLDD